ncbi:MAG: 23S rRNA (pseudouridine(1915)-N(3))-methyltransferase RlmH [Lachnospiraceae bacterium]|nr:23S rRNA (pseudouridine(1915)-N(3))-methyltransferase RlmH [Lachnospiraceae bacterium]
MKITIVSVGKIKEKFYRDAIDEYAKRLSKYCKFEIIEVSDEKTPEKCSEVEEQLILSKEADKILKHIRQDMFVYVLAIKGKKLDSVAFANEINQLGLSGKSSIAFVIGGSLGLHSTVLNRADRQLSFSDMTFPHQLMRVILSEQIYRCFRIIANEPYHK